MIIECLELFYFLSIGYGWYRWSSNTIQKSASLKKCSHKQWVYLCVALFAIYTLIFSLLTTFTKSTVPTLDSLTTSLSLTAQWLMCHKVTATWILWFFADAIYALMYLYKNLPFHTLLMLGYTAMALIGYARWRNQLKDNNTINRRPLDLKSGVPKA